MPPPHSSIFLNIAWPRVNYLNKSIICFQKVITQLVEVASYCNTTFWMFVYCCINAGD